MRDNFGPVRASSSPRAIPGDIVSEPFSEGRLRVVAELPSRPIDVRIGLPDVSRLLGEAADLGRLAEGRTDGFDECRQLDRVRIPEVVEVMPRAPIDGADDPVDDVRDERIIAPGGA